ncbi:hypothetical protein BDV96DRAFT_579003 [Lophiotrema nucula]|uniref:Uncharacterized protein n=1 Tax=Lophiotrema nucula TaxID=690887 RepID=A0A6A5Z1R6_9PLEO|nr:hypothetical protein BDV96DRAFT_579003 [Lophiotrema nucula]
MLGRDVSAVFATAALMSLIPGAFADDLVITPCASGSGTPEHHGCGGCDAKQAITATPWNTPADFKLVSLSSAADPNGGSGWNVWWVSSTSPEYTCSCFKTLLQDIPQPGDGCRVLIVEPFIVDNGSVIPGVTGNVISSVAHASCYFAHVSSRGVDVKFCCGSGDCGSAGAISSQQKRDLSAPPSRIMRDVLDGPSYAKRDVVNVETSGPLEKLKGVFSRSLLEARCFIGECDPPPPPAPPAYTCTEPKPTGDVFTKAGPVYINGQQLSCNTGEVCDISALSSYSASDTLTNEQSHTDTTTDGQSNSISVGWMTMIEGVGGPTFNYEHGWSHDQSVALGNSFSDSSGTTVTTTSTLTYPVLPGPYYNLWFQPEMSCQRYTLTCGGVDQVITRCRPKYSDPAKANITGLTGVMTIG